MKISLKQALTAWEQTASHEKEHLTVRRLYEMGQTGGFKSASSFEREHLSLCPDCFDLLWLFLPGDDAKTEYDRKDVCEVLGYGFLKAAAAGVFEPVEAKSSCGNFMFSIYPELERTDRGMAVLAVARQTDQYEGLQAAVRDASGAMILKSTIIQGRAAVKIDMLDRLDLSQWTIILSKPESRGPHE